MGGDAMKRIVLHWTAGAYVASDLDKRHYHEVVQGDGSRVQGNLLPEANLNTRDGNYAAHTRGLNTGSIGLAMCAMHGAQHTPFDAGGYPITAKQLNAFAEMVAEYAETYNIPVTRKTILSHAEVQPTLGIRQNGKWDITWLPGMTRPADPVKVGDIIRSLVNEKMQPPKPWWWRFFRAA